MKLNKFLLIGMSVLAFVACNSDDDNTAVIPTPGVTGSTGATGDQKPVVIAPTTYKFVNKEGLSTVSFGGQTTRLAQGKEILGQFTTFGTTEATIDEMFAEGKGFADASLIGTKIIRKKVAASDDYFKTNSVEAKAIKEVFDGYISNQVTTFLGKYADKGAVPTATKGVAGILGGKRLVNAQGLELNQAFNKGLIGAFVLDQIINNYIGRVSNADVVKEHNEGTLEEDKMYTKMEHFWDEAYGYIYGASTNLEDPNSVHLAKDGVVDSFLYKYIQRVNSDADFNTYGEQIFEAFKTGRAAIVAKEYTVLNDQVIKLRKLLSEVVAIRAVYYLKQGANKLKDVSTINDGSAFHDLSEGYGFVYSLRFTQNAEGKPYFTKSQVDGFIATLDAGNGFWDLADDTAKLDKIASDIAAKFDFTVAQAESTK